MVTCIVHGLYFLHFFPSGNYTCFFFYFIASWIGFVLGFFRTGSPSFTWGVVFLLVSHLFGFSVSPPRHHLTYPPPTRFGAFAATLIQLFPHTLILTHYYTRRDLSLFPTKRKLGFSILHLKTREYVWNKALLVPILVFVNKSYPRSSCAIWGWRHFWCLELKAAYGEFWMKNPDS